MPQASVAVCAWLRAIFDGFALERIDVGEAEPRVRHGGAGPPILLLHGHPRTHATWHRVAPVLAGRFTVVCPHLCGYGESSKPETTAGRSTVIRLPFGAAGPMTFAASPSIQVITWPRRYPKSWPPRSRRFCWLGGFRDCPAEAA